MRVEFIHALTTGANLREASEELQAEAYRRHKQKLADIEKDYQEACTISNGLHRDKDSAAYQISAAILDELKEKYKAELDELQRRADAEKRELEEAYAAANAQERQIKEHRQQIREQKGA